MASYDRHQFTSYHFRKAWTKFVIKHTRAKLHCPSAVHRQPKDFDKSDQQKLSD